MDTQEGARAALEAVGLGGIRAISDPGLCLYRRFGIPRLGLKDLLSPRLWARAFRAARIHGASLAAGDKMQSHGAVLLHRGEVVARAARPAGEAQDWAGLVLDGRP
jgi:hypothetical protein